MSDKLDEAEFWLPSEFLTVEDILNDNKENFNSYGLPDAHSVVAAGFCFPTQFPYDCGSVLSSPVESVVGSTETESDEEDSLLTGLTRQLTLHEVQKFTPTQQNLEKPWVLSGSPQSTLTQVGSWSGRSTMSSNGSPNGPSLVSSPPTTPLGANDDAWDLIYQAAGQVAKLKMNGCDGATRNPGLMGPSRLLPTPPLLRNSSPSGFYHNQLQQARGEQMMKQEACGLWSRQLKNGWSSDTPEVLQIMGGRIGMGLGSGSTMGSGMGQYSFAWPSQQFQQRNQQYEELGSKGGAYSGSGYGYGSSYGPAGGGGGSGIGGLKRERAGTGVFLPRRYGNNYYDNSNGCKTSDSRKKPGCSPALLPNKVAQAWTKNLDEMHGIPQLNSRYNNSGFIRDYDALVARRNALLAQQRRSLCPEGSISHEVCLPQEWTY